MLLNGLYEWKITIAHPILTIMFKDVLRTFGAEILEIFKRHSASTEKLDVLMKKKTSVIPCYLA